MSAQNVVGGAGDVFASLLLVSPVVTFWYVVKNATTSYLTPYPYVCTLVNAIFRVLYSIPSFPANVTVLAINGFGVLAETVYVVMFIRFANGRIRWILAGVLVFAYVGGGSMGWIVFTFAHTHKWIPTFLSIMAAISGGMMYLAPAVDVYNVFTNKNLHDKTLLFLAVCSLLNSACWTGYSFIGGVDWIIFAPNAPGILLSGVQVGVYVKCFNGPGIDEDDDSN